ncbi:MAG: hypothetical protein H6824_16230 [Planctomycetaceae bacterium]|nr:hypothetical protein [Planctomycetaceae bacterium]
MSLVPFRFVHAANLRLDEPLAGVGLGLTGATRQVAEEATLIAWDRIVDIAIEARAAFLLLTGNTFDEETRSLRARVALQRGLEKLDRSGVEVFIVPGKTDPIEAWDHDISLPENVTILCDERDEPVLVRREGRTIASVRVVATPQSDEADWGPNGPATFSDVSAPFHVGLVPSGTPILWSGSDPEPISRPDISRAAATLVKAAMAAGMDYIALGAGERRTHRYAGGQAHDPGVVQSLTRHISGPCGVSIVDVLPSGQVSIAPSTVAPVRWENIGLDVEPDESWDDLVERMSLALLEREPDSDDKMWIVRWKLRGNSEVLDSLSDPKNCRDLWQLIEAEVAEHHSLLRIHQLSREPLWDHLISASEETLGHTFLEILDEQSNQLLSRVQQELIQSAGEDRSAAHILSEVVETTANERVVSQARKIGMKWLV